MCVVFFMFKTSVFCFSQSDNLLFSKHSKLRKKVLGKRILLASWSSKFRYLYLSQNSDVQLLQFSFDSHLYLSGELSLVKDENEMKNLRGILSDIEVLNK